MIQKCPSDLCALWWKVDRKPNGLNLSLASFSRVAGRIPLSAMIGFSKPGTWTGTMSDKLPAFAAWSAIIWDLNPNLSWSSLETPNITFSLSANSPITSFELNSLGSTNSGRNALALKFLASPATSIVCPKLFFCKHLSLVVDK